ncbi:Heat shock protein 90-5, chloroplastic [Porphyridium purpureum]|uniref:Heat shock protein 90-5, chloroplastic n=1 Tax=Porphyridium purpureum TaxID=35688 RepID=A0A5J4Z8M1_PORPP|nr:Heat shock protein 90-5, chloroplastic [Porphyridium purpureum]|eukprot:POR8056..scf295_1
MQVGFVGCGTTGVLAQVRGGYGRRLTRSAGKWGAVANVGARRSALAAPVHVRRRASASALRMDAGAATEAKPEGDTKEEKFEFEAQVSRVMNIIINSLYSHPEVFLRELVSNASDACDKRKFLSLTSGGVADDLAVRVRAFKDSQTVVVEDNGVGMTRAECIKNLGSIATSGTAKFVEALGGQKGNADVSQIGQFGVGFYSAFLVADKVTVYTRSMQDDSPVLKWESTSASGYTIVENPEDEEAAPLRNGCGTRVVLHVKSGSFEFLENTRLKTLLKRYSEFIDFPIYAWEEKTEMEQVPDGDEKEEDGSPKMKSVPKTVEDWQQVNLQKPIWMRRPRDVSDDEYKEFYKTVSKEFDEPMAWTHFAAEGDVEFRTVLYTPSELPFDLRQDMFNNAGRNLKLYVKRVFISEKFEEFVPRWLCFLRGVIDSEDLPLNVSREILQQSRVLRIITKRVVRKALDMFKEISEREDPKDYEKFWKNFGRYIKAGVVDDQSYAAELSLLLRYFSSKDGSKLVSLTEYVQRMKESQKDIYYIVADSKAAAENSPVLEKLKAKGYEVLYMLEPVDEISIENLAQFKCKRTPDAEQESSFKLVNVSKENFKLEGEDDDENEKAELEELKEQLKDVTEYLQKALEGKVQKVQITDRLTDSPAAMVQSQYGVSPSMERFMRASSQASGNDDFSMFMGGNKVLEVNPKHPLIAHLAAKVQAKEEDPANRETAVLLYDLASLAAGYTIDDTGSFAKRVANMLVSSMGPVPDIPKAAEKKDSGSAPVDVEVVE